MFAIGWVIGLGERLDRTIGAPHPLNSCAFALRSNTSGHQ
jgi:hypothetical protein